MTVLAAFITGLTAGGLSCLAVQAGLLTSAVIDEEAECCKVKDRSERPQLAGLKATGSFLSAKIFIYTLFGGLLGALGAAVQLNAGGRGLLQIFVGLFMLVTALRLLNVHPVFEKFQIKPSKRLQRWMRARFGNVSSQFEPFVTGLLTIFVPCGVTQVVLAASLATGSAFSGAALMFAFTLGTVPVFLAFGYGLSWFGEHWQKSVMKLAGVAVLVLGLLAINGGLNLRGSDWSATAIKQRFDSPTQTEPQKSSDTSAAASVPENSERLTVEVHDLEYLPGQLTAKANQPYKLDLVTNKTNGCGRLMIIPKLGVEKTLPATGTVTVDIPPQTAGTTLRLTCGMGMYNSYIQFS